MQKLRMHVGALMGVILAVASTATGAGDPASQAARKAPTSFKRVHARQVPGRMPSAVGELQYDNNVPFARSGSDGGTVGNRFTNVGTHTISTVEFAAAGNFSTSMVMTVWDENPGSFMVLHRTLVDMLPQSPMASARFTAMLPAPIAHSGVFAAGLRNSDYGPCAGNVALGSTCDGVALTAGAASVLPGNAFRVPFNTSPFVPVINTVAGAGELDTARNAIFRVTGNNLPVELMHFEIN